MCPASPDGLKFSTDRSIPNSSFLIPNSMLQFRLKLGFLLGDLLGHLLPGLVQPGGQRVVGDSQNLGGQHGGVLGAAADGARSLERAPCPALQLLARLS